MDNIIAYFDGEKIQCLIGAINSAIFILASVYFLFLEKPFLKGLAYTIIPLSGLLLIICISVIARVPSDIARVTTFYQETPENIQTEEIPRMESVMKSFGIIKKVEMALTAIGLILMVVFRQNELVLGVATGLIVMGFILLLFDHIAESRGEIYIQFLNTI